MSRILIKINVFFLLDIGGCLHVYGEFENAKIFIRYAKEEREHNTHVCKIFRIKY